MMFQLQCEAQASYLVEIDSREESEWIISTLLKVGKGVR
jgi:hypothetical protein